MAAGCGVGGLSFCLKARERMLLPRFLGIAASRWVLLVLSLGSVAEPEGQRQDGDYENSEPTVMAKPLLIGASPGYLMNCTWPSM